VKKGLVAKFQDERDSRAVRVRLTGDGQKLQDEFEAISRLLNEKAFAGFTDSEIAVFEALLRKSLKNF
jgi:DNA-binding MarR family transcriptional regulator